MSHLNRNQGFEISLIKQTVQYAFFLVVFLWLLYQIHHSIYVRRDSDCDFIENKLTNNRIDHVLGRKGGVKVEKSLYTEEVELYGVDVIGEALRLNNDTDGEDDQSDNKPDYERNGVVNEMKSGNRSSEIGVILKKGESVEMFRFSDENGVPENESGVSMRSDARVSKAGNETEKIGAYYQNVQSSQNETDQNERPKMSVLQKEV